MTPGAPSSPAPHPTEGVPGAPATLLPGSSDPDAEAPSPSGRRGERLRDRIAVRGPGASSRDVGASVLVAAVSSGFGVILLAATGLIADILSSSDYLLGRETATLVIGMLSWLLLGLAVFVASIVTTTTFAAVVAGRVRQIALLRLLGASARAQRIAVAREGLRAGAVGAAIGSIGGAAVSAAGIAVASGAVAGTSPFAGLLSPIVLIPPVAVTLTTWVSAWAGSSRVLRVSPLEALAASEERDHREIVRRSPRRVFAVGLLVFGSVVVALGVVAGLFSPYGVLLAFAGGLLSFVGVAMAAPVLLPPVLRATGRLFGRSAVARLAAQNALRHPERASRMTVGVVLGVTLVTMFSAGLDAARTVLVTSAGEPEPAFLTLLSSFSAVMTALTAVSALIAAVGLVNLLSMGISQRRRELGLLRTLGLSTRQVRAMVLLEAAHLTITALVVGVVLGVLYGWAGAQAVFGSIAIPPSWESPTLVAPAVPVGTVLVVAVVTAALTLVATVVPTRRATSVSPIAALAVD